MLTEFLSKLLNLLESTDCVTSYGISQQHLLQDLLDL
jgi:hypothetical protein